MYPDLEIEIGLGPHLLSTAGQHLLGAGSGFVVDAALGYFPWKHHGFVFESIVNQYGSEGAGKLDPSLASEDAAGLRGFAFMFGYHARLYALPWLSLSYVPAIGPNVLELHKDRVFAARYSGRRYRLLLAAFYRKEGRRGRSCIVIPEK
jgi:hypothetical protein